ncbi:M23 family metallopeptidase [Streptomyces himalayensis]|uniref:M23 family metallopeptidase n=1 Tax=Streptomyces himalayensis subsp. himalayensis TaxID=2756131 RepID=A0A7W0DHW7_9ACTN|nr:M23 family metallopeptidase [Streptomyces himalayensis]MBA2945431.1 M23 family metallopeptidase [Streptomyces himalayensis subsp. himalayensis]
MRSSFCRPQLVPVLLCASLALAAVPATASPDPGGTGALGGLSTGAEVAQLYEDASVAAQQYETTRRAAKAQEARVRKLERLLARERRDIAVLHGDLGRIARTQYREGGGLPRTAQLLLADSPEDLIRGQQAVWQADLAVNNAVSKSQRAEARLSADEKKAAEAWRVLAERNSKMGELKRSIAQKLERALWKLQGEADRSAAAGKCPRAARLKQQKTSTTRAWVAPVTSYRLSAGFDSVGAHWAHRHTGQDFAVPIGTPVRAAGAGRVVNVSCGGAFGIEVVVQHSGGYFTQYAHLAGVTVAEGQRVRAGQWVGQSGTTGNSTGPHLHFEVRLTPDYGSAVDPRRWLKERGVRIRP